MAKLLLVEPKNYSSSFEYRLSFQYTDPDTLERHLITEHFGMRYAATLFRIPPEQHAVWRAAQGDIYAMSEMIDQVPSKTIQEIVIPLAQTFRCNPSTSEKQILSFAFPPVVCEAEDIYDRENIPAPCFFIPYGRFMLTGYDQLVADDLSAFYNEPLFLSSCPRCRPERFVTLTNCYFWKKYHLNASCACQGCRR